MSKSQSNSWLRYKETMTVKPDAHDYARSGDITSFDHLKLTSSELEAKNEKGHTPLMLAAYHGHKDLVSYLLDRGANPNAVDASGNSILMGVAFKGHADIAALLMSRGAHADYANSKQQTALDYAQMFGRTEVVKLIRKVQDKSQTFGLLDFLRSWSSFLNQRGARS